MGVRGLTTYIARNSEKYLEDHQLHDSYLVIDGNNLAAQLYKWHAKCNDCFGGDYDSYKYTVVSFFDALKKCNITPLVIFDGCYEDKKLRTIYSRVRNRIHSARKLNASTEKTVQVFPLFLRELFAEVVKSLNYKAVRCEFEADLEMACVARTLNCPVLSYDSDFYIFNVLYIPFSSLNFQPKCIRRRNSKTYFIESKLYKIDYFLDSLGGMDKANLPLLAVLLGNDYIKRSVFSNFYKHLKIVKRKSWNEQQRKIETVIRWLKNETYESAARKVLGRIKMVDRKEVAQQIKLITEGYICTESKVLPYFDIKVPESTIEIKPPIEIDLENLEEDLEDDEAETSSVSSDASYEVDETPSMVVDSLSALFPNWFLLLYRTSEFPAWFLDIVIHNRYFFIPQLEDYKTQHSHTISIPLLAALHKILTSGSKPTVVYIARNENSGIRNITLESSNMQLPTLIEIEDMSTEDKKKVLLDILQISIEPDILNIFPESWHVFILSIIYWATNCDVNITKNHMYAVILSAITLNIIDKKIGYKRTLRQMQAFDAKPNDEEGEITTHDCVVFMKEMIPFFYMEEKMCRNPRIYDISLYNPYARLQSCLFHIKYLNKVLKLPFIDFIIADFFNGTFMYNIVANLNKRTDPLAYLNLILKDAKSVVTYFEKVVNGLSQCREHVKENNVDRRRRRKTKRKHSENINDPEEIVADEEDECSTMFDENNKYSILNRLS